MRPQGVGPVRVLERKRFTPVEGAIIFRDCVESIWCKRVGNVFPALSVSAHRGLGKCRY